MIRYFCCVWIMFHDGFELTFISSGTTLVGMALEAYLSNIPDVSEDKNRSLGSGHLKGYTCIRKWIK